MTNRHRHRHRQRLAAVMFVAIAGCASAAAETAVERGRYLVLVSHCNNCHTAGYAQAEGAVSEDRWLKAMYAYLRGPGA